MVLASCVRSAQCAVTRPASVANSAEPRPTGCFTRSMSQMQQVADWLQGSPYSVPDDSQGEYLLAEMLPRAADLEERCASVRERIAAELAGSIVQATRTTEIYESNAIEGKTATLAETYEIMRSRRLWTAESAIASYTLHEALREEPKVQDVVGLSAARILVDQYLAEPDRSVMESDIRDMHNLILRGHRTAGRYKEYLNEISGSAHVPVTPVDVPAAMNNLVCWCRDGDAPLLWKAAVAHAWLTHIHPFEDGNGRIARLLANYLLGFGCYPPLIVKSTSDRPKYISALGHSDSAGDIVPLVRVFVRVLNRGIQLMEKPDFAWMLFQKDLQVREESIYLRWQKTLDRFLEEVAARLELSQMSLGRVGTLAPSDFELLRSRDRSGNAWLAKVTSIATRCDILVWVGHVSGGLHTRLEKDQVFPSLFLSERDFNRKAIRPYLPGVRGHEPLHDELTLLPDEGRALLRRGTAVTSVRLKEAAELWAALLREYMADLGREEHTLA